MNIGLVTSRDTMAPCFAGAELWVLGPQQEIGSHETVSTVAWPPLAWGRELLRRDVSLLFCAGIDRFLWGALHGYGIRVFADAVGAPEEAVQRWRTGQWQEPSMWPPTNGPRAGGRRRGMRRRFRGGR